MYTQDEWKNFEDESLRRVQLSALIADKTRQVIRNTFAKLQYLKSRYRENIQTFTDICLNMTPVKVLASLREFKNLVKLLARDASAWKQIPTNEQGLIIHAAQLAGVMIAVPAWVLLNGMTSAS